MIDHQDQSDHNQPDPAATDGNDSALERDDLQRVQDQAGIAGEPQPTDTPPHDPKPTEAATEAATEAEGHPS